MTAPVGYLGISIYLIPLLIALVGSWYYRRNALWKGEKIPRIFFVVLILLALIPMVNIGIVILTVIVILFANGDPLTYTDSKLNDFLLK